MGHQKQLSPAETWTPPGGSGWDKRPSRAIHRPVGNGSHTARHAHWAAGGGEIGNWLYGHGAEAPGQDGWIPRSNCG